MAALGIQLAVMMLLARWESMVVLKYFQDAPLASLTEAYRTLAERKETPGALAGIEKALKELQQDSDIQACQALELCSEFEQLKASFKAAEASRHSQLSLPDLVVNLVSNAVHKVSKCPPQTTSDEWSTPCGYHFALGPRKYKFVQSVPDELKLLICGSCMPDERALAFSELTG